MASTDFQISELFPQPKSITVLDGISDLSEDVRLVTSNVSPLQRKAIRSTLAEAGIRVVANKKKFVVDAAVEPPENFNLTKVPENCRKDYYELTVSGSEVHIRAPEQDGIVWASQTAAAVFRLHLSGTKPPNLIIKDWPVMPLRGIFVDAEWGSDRMNFADWTRVINHISTLKMNVLGIGMYNCRNNCRFESNSNPYEFLMLPVPGMENLKSNKSLKWYSAEKSMWKTENYVPATVEKEELLSEIMAYASEKAVTVVPFFSSLDNNTLIPGEIPEISAKDKDGNTLSAGYCTTSDKTKQFLENFYGSFLEKYYPDGASFFHIQLDSDPKTDSPYCKCPKCSKQSDTQNLQDYILWLTEMLTSKGVKKVVLWNSQLTGSAKALTPAFAERLENAGLKDKIIIHWKSTDAKADIKTAAKLGFASWAAPSTCQLDLDSCTSNRPAVEQMMRLAEKEAIPAAVAYSTHNPSCIDSEAILAEAAWNSTKHLELDTVQQKWSVSRFGDDAQNYILAADKIREAAAVNEYQTCLYTHYTMPDNSGTFPRKYPAEPLEALENQGQQALDNLRKAADTAKEAEDILVKMQSKEGRLEQDTDCLATLRAEAAKIQAIAETFICLLQLRQDLKPGSVLKRMATTIETAMTDLTSQMKTMEHSLPSWMIPVSMSAISKLYAFMEQLLEELKSRAGRKQAKQIPWTLQNSDN